LSSFAFIVSYFNRRYTGGKFRNLDKDIKLIWNEANPVKEWVGSIKKEIDTLTKLKPLEIIETPNRTLDLTLFVLLKSRGVTRDLSGRSLLAPVAAKEDKPEFHHIFPQKCLRGTQFEENTHHIANFTLITSKTNKEISKKKPSYLLKIKDDIKKQHFIPTNKKLYRVDRYDKFIEERQKLLANALNRFLTNRSK
ncbi:unnamed protein product, partial [marine sediment metagenome]